MTQPSRRKRVLNLLTKARDAARRPLYTEIVLVERQRKQRRIRQRSLGSIELSNVESRRSSSHDPTYENENPDRILTWEEVLRSASELAPFMTEQEYTELSQIASIFLLGFMMPYSTGNDWFLLQGAPSGFQPDFDAVSHILTMPLEDRLRRSIRRYGANEYGEINTLVDASTEIAFCSFIQSGLSPFLSSRHVSRDNVDLLHIIALATCPACSSPRLPDATIQHLDRINHPNWRRAKELMKDFVTASQFGISYGNRMKLVELVQKCLNIPLPLEEDSSETISPLLYGAIPHLRSALRDFADHWAMSESHAESALAAEARLARGNKRCLQEHWECLLHNMCEGSICDCGIEAKGECWFSQKQRLLCMLLRPQDSLPRVNSYALTALADAVEWQLDLWVEDGEGSRQGRDGASNSAGETEGGLCRCLLSSLLVCASTWFEECYTFLSKASKERREEMGESIQTLIQAGIRLVQHPDVEVATYAAKMLSAAITRRPVEKDVSAQLFHSIVATMSLNEFDCPFMKPLVGLVAKRSRMFSVSMISFLLNVVSGSQPADAKRLFCCSFISAIAVNCPSAISLEFSRVKELLDCKNPLETRLDIVACLLSIQGTQLSVDSAKDVAVGHILAERDVSRWTIYQMARHAMLNGNFQGASALYEKLLVTPLSEKHFLWMSALQQLAVGEAILNKNVAKGIPDAVIHFRSALTYFESLEVMHGSAKESFAFQGTLIRICLEYLDLLVVLRHLAWEMRISGATGKKHTRSLDHQQNVVRCLAALASKCRQTLKYHGSQTKSAQSLVSLGNLQSSFLILAKAAYSTFADSSKPVDLAFISGNLAPIPHGHFLKKVETIIDQPNPSIDCFFRARTLLEIIDGVLAVPMPLPSLLFSPLPRISARLLLSADPVEDNAIDDLDSIETSPLLAFPFICSGSVPSELLARPAVALLFWYSVSYVGPIDEDDLQGAMEHSVEETDSRRFIESRIPDLNISLPISGGILSHGTFHFEVLCPPLLDEGLFRIDARLGYEDSELNQWDLPLIDEGSFLDVRVLRTT